MRFFGAFDAAMPICVVLPEIHVPLSNTLQQVL